MLYFITRVYIVQPEMDRAFLLCCKHSFTLEIVQPVVYVESLDFHIRSSKKF